MSALTSASTPILVAHRAGNDPARLREAEASGVHMIECDIWLHRGRMEVRHEKTAGWLPVLWDRWSLRPGWHPRWTLPDLMREAGEQTLLFFDLKGIRRQLPLLLLEARAKAAPDRPIAVCSRNWELLAPFRDLPHVQRFYSAGSPKQLQALPARLSRDPGASVSINSGLLTPEIVRALKQFGGLVIPWRVSTLEQARTLLAWGVDGLNADDVQLLRHFVPNLP
jgi:glycerophosphoryl diester phosphodiesterase